MKQIICPICSGQIKEDNEIAVFAFPIKSLSDNADYDLISDFMKKEKIVHFDCLTEKFPNIKKILSGSFKSESKAKVIIKEEVGEFYEILKTLGEREDKNVIQSFLENNSQIHDQSELIKLWFKQRNRVS